MLAGILMVLGAGCQTEAAGAPPPTPRQLIFSGTFENGCSPVDASGIFIDLTSPEMDGWIQILVWGGLPLETGLQVLIVPDDYPAQAAYCRATNDCQVAGQGEILFSQVDGEMIQGQLWLELPLEGAIEGTFEAHWIDRGPVICG
jgi:hypothetical protein